MNLMHRLLRVALATCSTAPAFAGTIVVSKNGALSTIQSGIDAAAAGDTIKVLAGTYSERNITIPLEKAGLRIIGTGQVTIDATEPTANLSSSGFRIFADDVLLRNLTIQCPEWKPIGLDVSENGGIGIEIQATNAKIDKCTLNACSFGGIVGDVDSIQITNSKFWMTMRPIALLSLDAKIENCSFNSCMGAIVDVTNGENVEVRKSTFRNCAFQSIFEDHTSGFAIRAQSDAITVAGCKFEDVYIAMHLTGDVATITSNSILGTDSAAMEVSTSVKSTIKNNTLQDIGGHAIQAYGGATAGSAAEIVNNSILRTKGIAIWAELFDGSTIIDGNTAKDSHVRSWGIWLDLCASAVVTNNVIKNFHVGIESNSDGTSIESNRVEACGQYGLRVAANNASVRSNSVKNCLGEGLFNSGMNVIVEDNEFVENRLDVANTGSFSAFTGNIYSTGGPAALPESN